MHLYRMNVRLCTSLHWMPRLSATVNCWKRCKFRVYLSMVGIFKHCFWIQNKEEDIYVGENPYETPASRENDIYAQLQTWRVTHLNREDVEWVLYFIERKLTIKNYMQDCWSSWLWSVWQCGARSVEETGNSTSGRGTQESHQNIRGRESQVPPRSRHHGSVQTP